MVWRRAIWQAGSAAMASSTGQRGRCAFASGLGASRRSRELSSPFDLRDAPVAKPPCGESLTSGVQTSANGGRATLRRRIFLPGGPALLRGFGASVDQVLVETEEGGQEHRRAGEPGPPVDDEEEPDAGDNEQERSCRNRHPEQQQKGPDKGKDRAAQTEPAMRGVWMSAYHTLKTS